jgi:hypothetical protein
MSRLTAPISPGSSEERRVARALAGSPRCRSGPARDQAADAEVAVAESRGGLARVWKTTQ